MFSTGAMTAQTSTRPDCDRCALAMEPTGWIPKPDGSGGLRRLPVYRCNSCGRLYDELWGRRDATGDL